MRAPPLRLRDDPEAPPLARADLERAAHAPASGFDAAKGLAAFETAIRHGNVAGVCSAGSGIAGAIGKGVISGVLLVGGAVAMLAPKGTSAPDAPPPTKLLAASSAGDLRASPSVPAPTAEIESRPRDMPNPPAPSIPSRASPRGAGPLGSAVASGPSRASEAAVASARDQHPSSATPAVSDLQLEMDLVARMRAAEPGDPSQALMLAEEGRRRFPGGFFAQEREALAIEALARLGRKAEATERARAFLASYPKSHFAERLRGLTGG